MHVAGLNDHESGLEIYSSSAMQCVIIGTIGVHSICSCMYF